MVLIDAAHLWMLMVLAGTAAANDDMPIVDHTRHILDAQAGAWLVSHEANMDQSVAARRDGQADG